MLPTMDQATPEAPQNAAEPRPPANLEGAAGAASTPRKAGDASQLGCPFLVAEAGGWRLDVPSRAHRCGAVSPSAPLAPEKQARLCLTAQHLGCATLQASVAARGARLGPLVVDRDRTTRWGLARTTTVIEEAGGLRSRVTGFLLDRGRWPAIPAVVLVATLLILAASGLRPTSPASVGATATPPVTATYLPGPTTAATELATAPVEATTAPTTAPSTRPTGNPTPAPSGTPAPSQAFQTYTVKSGDTLSAIASKFHTTSRAIADLSGISVTSTLHVGQILKIPIG
jgi:LysM repeat protein